MTVWAGGNLWWMAIMMVAFWGALIWIAGTLIQRRNHTPLLHTTGTPPSSSPRQTPQEVLAERLARREIEPEDYRDRVDVLHPTSRVSQARDFRHYYDRE